MCRRFLEFYELWISTYQKKVLRSFVLRYSKGRRNVTVH
jgi:hypothetical protein